MFVFFFLLLLLRGMRGHTCALRVYLHLNVHDKQERPQYMRIFSRFESCAPSFTITQLAVLDWSSVPSNLWLPKAAMILELRALHRNNPGQSINPIYHHFRTCVYICVCVRGRGRERKEKETRADFQLHFFHTSEEIRHTYTQ